MTAAPQSPAAPPRDLQPEQEENPRRTRRALIAPLFLLALCWFSHFARSGSMGFYEDDHYFAAATMAWSPADLWGWVRNQVAYFPMPQGRPVGFILGGVLPYVGYHLAGLRGMYLLAFAVVGGNGVLFYTLLRRCLAPPMPLVAAAAFVLFPPDTTRPFLCHAHILFPSVTFTLVAAHLYLNGTARSRAGAYGMAVVALLTYETALLPFLFLPLLRRCRWDRRWAAGFAVHLMIVAGLAAGLFAVRQSRGESRAVAASAGVRSIASEIAQGTVIGNRTAWTMCVRRAVQGWYDVHDRRAWVALLVPVIAAAVAVTVPAGRATTAEQAALAGDIRRAAVFAAAASLVAYVFCFAPPHFPPDFTEGRLTSTHLAATMPICVAMGAVAAVPVLVGATLGLRRWVATVVVAVVAGGYFAAVFAAALDEQDGYIALWQARRQFWTALLDLCPDVGNRTVVVCDGRITPPAYYMGANSWSDYLVLMQCYRVPGGHFRRDPMVFVYPASRTDTDGWKTGLVRVDDHIVWQDGPVGIHARDNVLDQGNLILLHLDERNRLTRLSGSIRLCGRPFRLKPPPPDGPRPPYPTLPLYHLLSGR